MHRLAAAGAILIGALAADAAEGRVTALVITRVESPAFGGASFGDVGPYEKIVGHISGEVDPADPRDAVIVDLDRAPRNSRGMVEYSTPLFILKPANRANGNHRIFFDVNNRGQHRALSLFNDATASNNPSTAAHAGHGFLMRQGYTIVLSGWDVTAPTANDSLRMVVPVATHADGTPIVGPSLEELVVDRDGLTSMALTYAAAARDTVQASLTMRTRYADPPRPLPSTAWEFVDDRHVRLLPAGTAFQRSALYELVYPAKDPLVAGIAFAGLRDVIEFLRYARTDDAGQANPLAGDIEYAFAFGVSQPGRFLNDFVHLGFNSDSRGRKAFDAILSWIAGPSGGFFNYRFAQPGRTHRQHIGRWYPEFQFPFAWTVTSDPVTATTDGRLRRCARDNTCPYVFAVNSENEYWAKGGSLLHTDTRGKDLPDPPNVRHYLVSSLPHSSDRGRGICQQPRNPLTPNATLRALLVNLDAWVTRGVQPPPSRVPRASDGTMVESLPQGRVGFPVLRNVAYNGRLHEGDLLDFGPSAHLGILTQLPPKLVSKPYPVLVPKNDSDGNNLAGIRVVDIAVPVATYSGWALRAGDAGADGCDAYGQQLDFARTRAERMATGDLRPSLEERYPTHDDYVQKVTAAATRLERDRFLLAEDRIRVVERAAQSAIGTPGAKQR
ncbi:MAG: alpha/beta hydrolase domain-containing protein [Vicinamibacterales bacterium]